jgi:hypothetical protein
MVEDEHAIVKEKGPATINGGKLTVLPMYLRIRQHLVRSKMYTWLLSLIITLSTFLSCKERRLTSTISICPL